MPRSMSTDWRRLAVSTAAFVGLILAAMLLYPGGDRFHPGSEGYRFWQTFLCDLLEATTPGGHPNGLGSILTAVAIAVLTLGGMLPLWWTPPGAAASRAAVSISRVSGLLCCALTLLICLEVGLHLSISHEAITLSAGAAGMVASSVPFVTVLRAPKAPATVKVTGGLVLAAVLANLALYCDVVWSNAPMTPLLATVQKCALLLVVLWLAQLAVALRHGDLGGSADRGSTRFDASAWSTIKGAEQPPESTDKPGL